MHLTRSVAIAYSFRWVNQIAYFFFFTISWIEDNLLLP